MTIFGRTVITNDNPGSPNPPNVANDTTEGFQVGSFWLQTPQNVLWYCADATAGAAKWFPLAAGMLLGRLIGASMAITTDQPFVMCFPVTASGFKFAISKILAVNASVDLDTAAGGIYDTAAKGGNAIVANTQVYTALTAAGKVLSLTIAAAGSGNAFSVAPILSLTTGQGAPSTADFYLYGDILTG